MSERFADSSDLFSRESRLRETILTEFEEAWFRGERPEISDFLQKTEGDSHELLLELVHIELEFRFKQGETPRIEQYFGRFPELADDADSLSGLAAAEYELRRRQGEDVSVDEYVARFPEIAPQLRDRLNTVAQPGPDGVQRSRLSIDVISGPHRGLRFETDEHRTYIVGRGSESQIQLIDDPHFSRFHLRLEVAPPACRLVDLDSRNGTFVNGRRVDEALLKDGDVISGGSTRMVIRIEHRAKGFVEESPPCATAAPFVEPVANEKPASPLPRLPVVPGFRLEKRIGSGAIGDVYRAMHTASGMAAAVKLIRTSRPDARQPMLAFIRQMSRLADLQHNGIVQLLEVGLADGRPFVATEFVDVVSADKVLQAERPAQRDRLVCRIVGRVLDALQHAHGQSLVHGGIKPSNVLFTAEDRTLTVKLSDFGLASIWMETHLSSVSNATPYHDLAFMPPEQVRDCRAAAPATDIYSTGILLYQLLCGELPFDVASEQRVLDQILNARLIPLSKRRPDLPVELIEIVGRAVQYDAAGRYSTAAAMQDELQEFTR